MGASNNKGNRNLNGIAGIITAIGTVVTVATPLIEKAIDSAGTETKVKVEDKVKIPELYRKGFPIDLEQAIKILEDCGLKSSTVSSTSRLTLRESNPKYKDCFDSQVIDSNPKQGTTVKIGSTICLRYIPNEVIVESQRLFDEMEHTKVEAREKKEIKKLERRETIDKAAQGVRKIFKRNSKDKIDKGGETIDEQEGKEKA